MAGPHRVTKGTLGEGDKPVAGAASGEDPWGVSRTVIHGLRWMKMALRRFGLEKGAWEWKARLSYLDLDWKVHLHPLIMCG